MDLVTAIGFASSILTFIEFSWGLVTGTYKVYKSAAGTAIENAHINTVIDDLQKITEDLSPEVDLKTRHGKALCQLAEKCNELSKDLLKILEKLQATDRNPKGQSMKRKLMSMRKENEISCIEKRLHKYRSQIIMRLNFMLSEEQSFLKMKLDKIQAESSRLQTQSGSQFADLRTQVDHAVHEVLHKSDEAETSKRNSEAEKRTSLADIRNVLGQLQTMVKVIPRENRILLRLYFPSMCSREDTVADPESGTFTWIVDSDKESTSSETGSDEGGEEKESENGDSILPDEGEAPEQGGTVTEYPEPAFEGSDPRIERINDASHHDSDQGGSIEHRGSAEIDGADETSSFGSLGGDSRTSHDMDMALRDQTRDSFLSWLVSGGGIYHISGKAGSGKSTLMKFLSNHPRVQCKLEAWAGEKTLVFAHFFFWNSGDKLQMSLEGLYRALLFEALKKCPELIPQVFPEHWHRLDLEDAGFDKIAFRMPEIKAAFNNLINNHTFPNHRFCFFIDGLDEYEGDSVQYWELAQSFQTWASAGDFKICVSSRPHTEFMDTFSDEKRLRLRLHEITSADIRRFALAMSEKDANFGRIKDVYLDLVDEVVYTADGVFLWARLVVRSLLEGVGHRYSTSALKEKLSAMPKGLDDLFDSFNLEQLTLAIRRDLTSSS